MRKILYHLMALLVLMPALTCGVGVCSMKAQARSFAVEQQDMPCHEKKSENKGAGLMFFKDCAGVDLAQTDYGDVLEKPDFQVEKVSYVLFLPSAGDIVFPSEPLHNKGPPLKSESARISSFPLYLMTQRLRV